jgi:hypothetical protein
MTPDRVLLVSHDPRLPHQLNLSFLKSGRAVAATDLEDEGIVGPSEERADQPERRRPQPRQAQPHPRPEHRQVAQQRHLSDTQ